MADVARLLELMHPMREPPPPGAVSPTLFAIGFGCAVAVAAYLGWRLVAIRRSGLRRSARTVLATSRSLAPRERLAAQAMLLRRLVRALLGENAARAQGEAWLGTLDRTFDTRYFTTGAGAAYGDALYARTMPDVEALDRELDGLITKLPAQRHAHVA